MANLKGAQAVADNSSAGAAGNAYKNTPVQLEPLQALSVLMPSILGLAFARASVICLSYGNYASSDCGLATEGGTLIALIPLLIMMGALSKPGRYVGRRLARRLMLVSVLVLTCALVGLSVFLGLGLSLGPAAKVALSFMTQLCFVGTAFFWLRHARGTDGIVVTMYVMLAIAVSAVLTTLMLPLPRYLELAAGAVLCVAQIPMMRLARRREPIFNIRLVRLADSDEEIIHDGVSSKAFQRSAFLVTLLLGITAMGFIAGIMRGFPVGATIDFLPGTRVLYAALTIVACIATVIFSVRSDENGASMFLWVVLMTVASLALVLFSAYPGRLDIGLAFANTTNLLMVGLFLMAGVSFASVAKRDAYYYFVLCMVAYLIPRASMRTLLSVTEPDFISMPVMLTSIGLLLLVCCELVFIRFMLTRAKADASRIAALQVKLDETSARGGAGSSLQAAGSRSASVAASDLRGDKLTETMSRLLGVEKELSASELSELSLKQLVDEISRTFGLSDREEEVMLLYVQGATQSRIAERLNISVNTAHAHIKHIYAKCNLHSRQELIDLMHSLEKL